MKKYVFSILYLILLLLLILAPKDRSGQLDSFYDPLYSQEWFNKTVGTNSGRATGYATTGFVKLEDNYLTGGTYLNQTFGGDCLMIDCEVLLYQGPEADPRDTTGTFTFSYTRHDTRTGEKKDFSYEIPLDYEILLD